MTGTLFSPAVRSRFDAARRVADAVLFEGYVLYPYRASSVKNRLRWQFGVLAPPAEADSGSGHVFQRTEVLMEPRGGAQLCVELRFLHVQRRTVQQDRGDGFEDVAALELADRVVVPWDEGVEERVELAVPVAGLTVGGAEFRFGRPEHQEAEPVAGGRLLRRRERLDGLIRLAAVELPGPYAVLRLTAEVENTSEWLPGAPGAPGWGRDAGLARSLVSAHLLLGLTAGSFLSMADPPEWARGAAARCRNLRTWPVLAGQDGGGEVVLSSPIILEDHPRLAPESPGPLYDATEIDEILALRTATLTEGEKREARGTDARAAAVIDLAESLPAEVLDRLHGAVRSLREATGGDAPPVSQAPDGNTYTGADGAGTDGGAGRPVAAPDTPWWDPAADRGFDPARDHVSLGGHRIGAGSRVLLKPGPRRTDAQDLFLHGRTARVEAVLHDVDGAVHLAVTVDDDPGADLRREQGRFLYFQPDEVAPVVRP